MKKDLHPDNYRLVVFQDKSADFKFLTRSCAQSSETIQWEDGNEYPVVSVEISSASHPFYTGKQKFVDAAGRLEKFGKKYNWEESSKDQIEEAAKKRKKKAGKEKVSIQAVPTFKKKAEEEEARGKGRKEGGPAPKKAADAAPAEAAPKAAPEPAKDAAPAEAAPEAAPEPAKDAAPAEAAPEAAPEPAEDAAPAEAAPEAAPEPAEDAAPEADGGSE